MCLPWRRLFAKREKSEFGATTVMILGNCYFAGFFFGFTGYFGRPARGLVC
jgi:hypothetical protein